jgi:hypothetical protein
LRAADPHWTRPLLGHALPLSLLPAIAWPIGQSLAGVLPADMESLGRAFAATAVFSLASVLLLGLGIFVLAPLFRCPRLWGRSMAIAAYASTPVLLSGGLLFVPMLVLACFAAFAFLFVLCDMGVTELLGCREAESASYVVGSCLFAGVGSMALGALCSAAGLI